MEVGSQVHGLVTLPTWKGPLESTSYMAIEPVWMFWGRVKSLSHFEVFAKMQLMISFFWDIMVCQ
jgi:hypothetical protein